jgi:predicted nucleic acid-binding protein
MKQPQTEIAEIMVLDAGALIGLERGDERVAALLREVSAIGTSFAIPAGVVAQVWRAGHRQARLSRLLADPAVEVVALDAPVARAAGVLCAASSTRDVIDASVVLCARQRGNAPIVTSDGDDLARLDPGARLVVL